MTYNNMISSVDQRYVEGKPLELADDLEIGA